MPLPFLTVEGDSAKRVAGSEPFAYEEDRQRWRRPYRPGPWRVAGAALLLLLASYVLFSALIIALAGALAGASVCLGCAVLIIVVAIRLVRVGIWVSEQGLRLTGVIRSTSVTWKGVASIRTVQQPVRWLGLPRTVQGQALVVTRRRGEPLWTPLTDHNADFLGRTDAFVVAAAAVRAWDDEYRESTDRNAV